MEMITLESSKEMRDKIALLTNTFPLIIQGTKPLFNGERYLIGNEVCSFLRITKRTLQEYRDNGDIPYISLGGKFLYKESDIISLLEENYIPRINY